MEELTSLTPIHPNTSPLGTNFKVYILIFNRGCESDPEQGCNSTEDAQDGVITPILIDPDENEYFCSDIPVAPSGQTFVSTCNVTDNVVTKSSMYSGEWIIIIEGLTFAWERSFYITAGPQATVTATPTAIFNVTVTPTSTVNSTVTTVYSTTLTPSTVTLPSVTLSHTRTITPKPVTTTSTKTVSIVQTKFSYTVAHTTKTKTASCTSTKRDPPCTFQPTKTKIAADIIASQISAASDVKRRDRMSSRRGLARRGLRRSAALELEKRSPGKYLVLMSNAGLILKKDVSTTTVTETTSTASVYSTYTASTITVVNTYYTTVTNTITPAPITVKSGATQVQVTVTAPTPTRTIRTNKTTKTTTTKTITATITKTKTVTPTCSKK
ncbi:hypothetical protein UCRPC4_g00873 [Phaeomoniella chlamydospora]|uniref:Uncharacterized protein n=1 Tax=Phaeomoniella chlamydospora TaxID=158046 RepID=A0A0G2HGQ6_PHACM|nr:hypothetical protein UCRPC4_g00873 [Phaeomoniella chlamydospora]